MLFVLEEFFRLNPPHHLVIIVFQETHRWFFNKSTDSNKYTLANSQHDTRNQDKGMKPPLSIISTEFSVKSGLIFPFSAQYDSTAKWHTMSNIIRNWHPARSQGQEINQALSSACSCLLITKGYFRCVSRFVDSIGFNLAQGWLQELINRINTFSSCENAACKISNGLDIFDLSLCRG